jgi:hypothetical protein
MPPAKTFVPPLCSRVDATPAERSPSLLLSTATAAAPLLCRSPSHPTLAPSNYNHLPSFVVTMATILSGKGSPSNLWQPMTIRSISLQPVTTEQPWVSRFFSWNPIQLPLNATLKNRSMSIKTLPPQNQASPFPFSVCLLPM